MVQSESNFFLNNNKFNISNLTKIFWGGESDIITVFSLSWNVMSEND